MPYLIRMCWGMGDSPPRSTCAPRRERDHEPLDCICPGGRLLTWREWKGDGLAFGEYSTGMNFLD